MKSVWIKILLCAWLPGLSAASGEELKPEEIIRKFAERESEFRSVW
jgi:hypothetical protein